MVAEGVSSDSDFPVLTRVLRRYYYSPNGHDRHDHELVTRYRRHGEDSIEFAGLLDELSRAVNQPATAAQLVNEMLEVDLEPDDVQQHLIDLHDQLTESGEYSDPKVNRPAGDVLARGYLLQRTSVPLFWKPADPATGQRPTWQVPLWLMFLAGAVAVAAGVVVLPVLPGFLQAIPLAMVVAGFVAVLWSGIGMLTIRGEMLDPGAAARKERQRRDARAERHKKRERRHRWLKI